MCIIGKEEEEVLLVPPQHKITKKITVNQIKNHHISYHEKYNAVNLHSSSAFVVIFSLAV